VKTFKWSLIGSPQPYLPYITSFPQFLYSVGISFLTFIATIALFLPMAMIFLQRDFLASETYYSGIILQFILKIEK